MGDMHSQKVQKMNEGAHSSAGELPSFTSTAPTGNRLASICSKSHRGGASGRSGNVASAEGAGNSGSTGGFQNKDDGASGSRDSWPRSGSNQRGEVGWGGPRGGPRGGDSRRAGISKAFRGINEAAAAAVAAVDAEEGLSVSLPPVPLLTAHRRHSPGTPCAPEAGAMDSFSSPPGTPFDSEGHPFWDGKAELSLAPSTGCAAETLRDRFGGSPAPPVQPEEAGISCPSFRA